MTEHSLEQITNRMRDNNPLNPNEAAEMRRWLAGEYSWIASQLEDILKSKADHWLLIRENSKSDKATEMEWSRTKEGLRETTFRSQLKRMEKLLSSLRTFLEIANQEARNIF